MATRQSKFAAYSGLYTAIVIAALVVINVLADRHNKSVDTTSNKRFSLADQTEKIVKNLKNEVKATYFDRAGRFDNARGMLDRYANLSSNFKVEYLDIDKDRQKALAMGARASGTLILDNGARKEEAKAVTEQEITGALVRLQQTGQQTVCALEGHGERTFESPDAGGLSVAKQALERNNVKTQAVKFQEKPEIPMACTIILSAGPTRDYSDDAVKAIKAFVDGGGDALFLLTPAIKAPREEVDANPKLTDLLASWNIAAGNDLVIAPQAAVVIEEFAQHPIVRDLNGRLPVVTLLARSLDVKPGAEKLFSTPSDVYATKTLDVAKLQSVEPPKDVKGPITLGAATTVGSKDSGDLKKQGRVVVIGSADWVGSNLINRYGNRDLFLNAINWLGAEEDLISIRPREPEDRRLTARPSQYWMLYATSFLPPLGILLGGVFVWLKRR